MISGTLLFLLSALGFSSSNVATAFTASPSVPATAFLTHLSAKSEEDDEYMRWARQARSADVADNVVELVRPLGLVLKEDDRGNVFVDKVAPKGNAARTGKVQVGDVVTMCSATFGNDMWSTRGVGLTRVLAAIRVRAGLVRLVFETPAGYQKKVKQTKIDLAARAEAEAAAQAKKDALLQEMDSDETKLKGQRKFFGLW